MPRSKTDDFEGKDKALINNEKTGAPDKVRTRDPLITNVGPTFEIVEPRSSIAARSRFFKGTRHADRLTNAMHAIGTVVKLLPPKFRKRTDTMSTAETLTAMIPMLLAMASLGLKTT